MGSSGASGSGGGLNPSGMRLTTSSIGAILEEDAGAAGTLYLAPFRSNRIWLPDTAGVWAERTVTNIPSVSLAALTVGQCVDIFARWNSGAVELAILPGSVWTSSTNRGSAPLALDATTGMLVNGFGTGTYAALGCVQATGAGVTRDSVVNGRYVCNAYNRLARHLGQSRGSGTFTETSGTYVQANAAAAWTVASWMEFQPPPTAKGFGGFGTFRARFTVHLNGNATSGDCWAAIGLNSTTVPDLRGSVGGGNVQIAGDGEYLVATLEGRPTAEGQQRVYALLRINGGGGSHQLNWPSAASNIEYASLFATVEV